MNRKGQGATEYILVIAAALIVLAIAMVRLFGVKGAAVEGGKVLSSKERNITSELSEFNSSTS